LTLARRPRSPAPYDSLSAAAADWSASTASIYGWRAAVHDRAWWRPREEQDDDVRELSCPVTRERGTASPAKRRAPTSCAVDTLLAQDEKKVEKQAWRESCAVTVGELRAASTCRNFSTAQAGRNEPRLALRRKAAN
jgi:hypothetical protein